MPRPRSRVTAQGQISVPAEVRRKLGIGPGAVLEWGETAGEVVVRRVGQHSSEDIHVAVFGPRRPSPKSAADLKAGIRRHVKSRRARR